MPSYLSYPQALPCGGWSLSWSCPFPLLLWGGQDEAGSSVAGSTGAVAGGSGTGGVAAGGSTGGVGAGAGVGAAGGVGTGLGGGVGCGLGTGAFVRGVGGGVAAGSTACGSSGGGSWTTGTGWTMRAGGAGTVTRWCGAGRGRRGTASGGSAAITIEGDEVRGRLSGLSAIDAGPSRREGVSRSPIPTVSDSAATAPCAQESLMCSPDLADNNCRMVYRQPWLGS
jgi:hypothetical protein